MELKKKEEKGKELRIHNLYISVKFMNDGYQLIDWCYFGLQEKECVQLLPNNFFAGEEKGKESGKESDNGFILCR